jgi:hypothetical protein
VGMDAAPAFAIADVITELGQPGWPAVAMGR